MIDFIAIIWPLDQHNIGRLYDKWGCRLQRVEWQNSELNTIDLMLFTLLWPPIDFLSHTYGVMALSVCMYLPADTVELTHSAWVWFITWISKSPLRCFWQLSLNFRTFRRKSACHSHISHNNNNNKLDFKEFTTCADRILLTVVCVCVSLAPSHHHTEKILSCTADKGVGEVKGEGGRRRKYACVKMTNCLSFDYSPILPLSLSLCVSLSNCITAACQAPHIKWSGTPAVFVAISFCFSTISISCLPFPPHSTPLSHMFYPIVQFHLSPHPLITLLSLSSFCLLYSNSPLL